MLHSCEQTPRHAAAWGRGVQGIRQNFFAACARHAIQTRPSFRRRGVPRCWVSTNPHFAASSIASCSRDPTKRADRGGALQFYDAMPAPSNGLWLCFLPVAPADAHGSLFPRGRERQNKKQSETFKPPTVVCFAVSSRAARMWRRCIAGRHCPPRRSLPCPPAPARRG